MAKAPVIYRPESGPAYPLLIDGDGGLVPAFAEDPCDCCDGGPSYANCGIGCTGTGDNAATSVTAAVSGIHVNPDLPFTDPTKCQEVHNCDIYNSVFSLDWHAPLPELPAGHVPASWSSIFNTSGCWWWGDASGIICQNQYVTLGYATSVDCDVTYYRLGTLLQAADLGGGNYALTLRFFDRIVFSNCDDPDDNEETFTSSQAPAPMSLAQAGTFDCLDGNYTLTRTVDDALFSTSRPCYTYPGGEADVTFNG